MITQLNLSQIRLYLDNPRLSKSENELEALFKVVEDQEKKLIALGKDIAAHGLSDLDVIAVFPDDEQGYFRVAEGNRRISALKLLQDPDLIISKFPTISKEFSAIPGRNAINFKRINASIFPDEKDPLLIHLLEVRHLGEQSGVGTVKWDAKQKGRFDYKIYGKENLVIFLDDLQSRGILTAPQINGVTKTNWDRILRPIGLDFLHLYKENGTYKIEKGFEEEFTKKIRLVADELNGKTVGTVYGKTQIEDFFSKLEPLFKGEVGNTNSDYPAPKIATDNVPNNADTTQEFSDVSLGDSTLIELNPSEIDEGQTILTEQSAARRRMPHDSFKNCPSVIPTSYRLQSRNHRITRIIKELKELRVETYSNACGCLLRALIELSAKEYLEHHAHPRVANGDATEIEFRDAIFAAADDMVSKGRLSVDKSRIIKKETEKGGVRQLFNGYMHNKDTYPSSIVIKDIFLVYRDFIFECLR